METYQLSVKRRHETKKGAAHRIRQHGAIPAVLYGKGIEPILLTCDPSDLLEVFHTERGRNSVLRIEFDGNEPVLALIQDIQLHPLSRKIIHSDFLEVVEEQSVTVNVPLQFVGKAEGVKAGGLLQPVRRNAKVRCRPADIPVALDVDVSDLDIGGSRLINEIKPPDGVEIVYKTNYSVATVLK